MKYAETLCDSKASDWIYFGKSNISKVKMNN